MWTCILPWLCTGHASRQRQGDGEGEIARRPVITRQPSVTEHITSIVPDYLQCAVCMSVFNQPHQDRCGHVFCLGCLQGMLQDRRTENCCPVCRGDMSEDSLYPNLLCKNLIGQLSTRCPARGEYNGRKCDWQGLIDNLSEHQKSCELHQQATCKRGGGTTEYNGDTDNNKNNNNTNDASSSSSPSSSWQVMNVDIVGKEAELVRIPEHMLQYDARKDVRGGVSGKEFVANLGKGGPQGYNKWFAGPLETEAEVLVHLHYPQRVHHYRISSASDHTHMHRNPISWEVWGLQEEKDDKAENWVMMHSVNTNHNHSKSRLSAGSSSGSSSSDSGSDSISPQFTQPLEWKNYNLDNPTNEYWKCIKLVITGNQGPEAGVR